MKRYHGFTLVELLVVITVISVLAALLLPVIQKSVQSARSVACMNNEKQLHTCLMSYADDYNDYLPPTTGYGTNWQSGINRYQFWNWSDYLSSLKYIDYGYSPVDYGITNRLPGVFRCPNGDMSKKSTAGYGLMVTFEWVSINHKPWKPGPHKINRYSPRSSLLTDGRDAGCYSWTDGTNTYDTIKYRHPDERANILFLDGHVSAYGYPYYVSGEEGEIQ